MKKKVKKQKTIEISEKEYDRLIGKVSSLAADKKNLMMFLIVRAKKGDAFCRDYIEGLATIPEWRKEFKDLLEFRKKLKQYDKDRKNEESNSRKAKTSKGQFKKSKSK